MSISYGPLASWYDRLTGDVPYEDFLAFYEAEFQRHRASITPFLISAAAPAPLHG